jgi:hypothetical protein
MGSRINVCEICGLEEKIKAYQSYKCARCNQEYDYDNDCYRIILSYKQIEILKKEKNITS